MRKPAMDRTLMLNTPWATGKQGALPSGDDPAYDEYVDEVENMRHRLLEYEYEYVDVQKYDYLLPTHLTYGKDQTPIDTPASIRGPDVKSLPGQLGEIGGLALSQDNRELIVFHRGSHKWENKDFTSNYRFRNEAYGPIEEDVVLHIDTRTGKTKHRWRAKMFYIPHRLIVNHAGNFWMTDIAMYQVFMFKPSDLTHPALTVGKMHFRSPQ